MRSFPFLSFFFSCLPFVVAQYTIYQPKEQVIFGGTHLHLTATPTTTAVAATFSSGAAWDYTSLSAPPVPSPPISTQVPIQLPSSGGFQNMSSPVSGAFMGFSIEMSVANQVLGKNSTRLQVPFLNLMSNIVERVGWVQVRVGGNSQEDAQMVASLPNGTVLAKDNNNTSGVTSTPPLVYTADLLQMMENISNLVNVHWYLGIPFANNQNISLAIVETAQRVLGSHMIGFQAGNEPDLYNYHGHRPASYSQYDYFGEIGSLVEQISGDSSIPNKDNLLIVPSIQTLWTPESVWNTGIVGSYNTSIYGLAVERYPDDNCAALYANMGAVKNPQDVFPNYLTHNASISLVSSYVNSTSFARQNGKPFIMFETNSASCGGFPGLSDSFGAALWGLDWALTMVANGFTTAMFHVGGQSDYYNPFTPPPTNQTKFGVQWTVGPIYYSALVMAEVLGPHNQSQVSDITQDLNTPMYAIFENGAPTKVALFNFVTDQSGASTYNAVISIGSETPSRVKVKYLLADSVASKGAFTWAGQTLGDPRTSDGRLNGTLNVTSIDCDESANTCSVPVPAPGFALVFLTSDAINAVSPTSTVTFPTTTARSTSTHIFIDPSMLATSYGHVSGKYLRGATSGGNYTSGVSSRDALLSGALTLLAGAAGVAAVVQPW